MKQFWPHIPLLVFVILLAVVGLHLASKSNSHAEQPSGITEAPAELQGLANELAKPEYQNLSKEEALRLLESRGFDFNRPPPKEEGP